MFGVGASELVIIVVLALLVVGPKRLPGVLRKVGRALGDLRRSVMDLRKDVGYDEVVDDVTRPLREGMAGLDKDTLAQLEKDTLADPSSPEAQAALEAVPFIHEYPFTGPDDYDALPEDAQPYPEQNTIAKPQAPKATTIEVRRVEGSVSRDDAPDANP